MLNYFSAYTSMLIVIKFYASYVFKINIWYNPKA